MHITCPRCSFKGEAAFEFKPNSLFARVRETISGASATKSSIPTAATDEEIGEYAVCPRCISVYAFVDEVGSSGSNGRASAEDRDAGWGDGSTLYAPSSRKGQMLTLLTAQRLRRFTPAAQERLRSRMESYFKLHRNSALREDGIEYLQKYIVELLKTEEKRRMRLSELTLSFAALSEEHPFFEALTRLKNRGRLHTFEEEGSPQGETTVMLV